jgi:hypothetical protein
MKKVLDMTKWSAVYIRTALGEDSGRRVKEELDFDVDEQA